MEARKVVLSLPNITHKGEAVTS